MAEGTPRTWTLRRFRATAIVTVPVVRQGPRNVLIEHADGHRLVRPFRGLRCSPDTLEPAK